MNKQWMPGLQLHAMKVGGSQFRARWSKKKIRLRHWKHRCLRSLRRKRRLNQKNLGNNQLFYTWLSER